MSVTGVKEVVGDEGTHRLGEKSIQSTYRRKFIVTTDNPYDNPIVVRRAGGIPRLGTSYAIGTIHDPFAICVNVSPRLIEPGIWEVDCDYDTDPLWEGPEEPGEEKLHPLDRPSIIHWSSIDWLTYHEKDLLDKPYQDTHGTPFQSVPPHEDGTLAITITRNEPSFDERKFMHFIKTINSDSWYGRKKKHCKIHRLQGDPLWEQGVAFVRVTYEIHIRRHPWEPVEIRNRGPMAWVDQPGGGRIAKLVTDGNNHAHGGLADLDKNGYQLADGEDPIYLKFYPFELAKFGQLNLP